MRQRQPGESPEAWQEGGSAAPGGVSIFKEKGRKEGTEHASVSDSLQSSVRL